MPCNLPPRVRYGTSEFSPTALQWAEDALTFSRHFNHLLFLNLLKMHRSITEGNKLCYRRQVELERRLHEERLREVKAVVERSPVCSSPRSGRNLKYETMTHERLLQIDRENRILLDRLYRVMDRPPCTALQTEPRGPSTLNFANRRDQQQRIAYNNKFTYQKIVEAKPHLNFQEWERHAAFYAGRFRNICERPAVLNMKDVAKHKKADPATIQLQHAAHEKALARVRNVYNLATTPRLRCTPRPATNLRMMTSPRKHPPQSPPVRSAYLRSMDKDYARSLQEMTTRQLALSPATSPKCLPNFATNAK